MSILLALALLVATASTLAWIMFLVRRAQRLSRELTEEGAARALLASENARLSIELASERAGAAARLAELHSTHERLKAEFAELSSNALRSNRDDFLKLAEQSFARLRETSSGELSARQEAIGQLVKPLRESLDKVDGKIAELEQRRERAYGDLGRQLESLSAAQLRLDSQTAKLSTVLGATRTAGTWGELQLRRVVELAGMTEHCDFDEQPSLSDESGRVRPDLVVHLPGDRQIAVDAKAPTDAFREAAAETDPGKRALKLGEHAAKVRGHIDALASREYWSRLASPDFVILFLPGDSFLSAAIESDPSIMDRAIERKVLLATPMTLVALLKASAYGWRQEAVSKNAEEIARLGRELYNRITGFADHLGSTSHALASAVASFNKAIGSFEQNLLPGARRFTELGAKGTKELEAPERVSIEAREPLKRS